MGVTLAGQPVLLDHGKQVESMIYSRMRSIIWPSMSISASDAPRMPNSRAGTTDSLFELPYGTVPTPRINEWIDPTGISRYGRGLYLAGKDTMYAIASAAFGTSSPPETGQPDDWGVGYNPVTLSYDYNSSTVERSVYLISPICIDAFNHNSIWLLPVVDERYRWLDITVNILRSDCETWAYLFDAIGTAIGKTITVPAVNSAFGIPDIRAWSESRVSAAVAVDVAAMSIGLRATLGSDGEIVVQNAATAIAAMGALNEHVFRFGGSSPEIATPVKINCQGPTILDYFDDGTTWQKDSEPDKAGGSDDANPYNVYSTFALHKINGTILTGSETVRDAYVDKLGELLLTWTPIPGIGVMPGIVPLEDCTAIDYSCIHVSGTDDVYTSFVTFPHDFHPKTSLCQWPDNYVHASPTAYFTKGVAGFPAATISLESSWYEGTPDEEVDLNLPPWVPAFDPAAEDIVAYYQKGTGWVVWAGEAESKRIQFLTLGKIVDRVVSAKVIWFTGSLVHPTTGEPLELGDTIDVYDPVDMWGEIEENATGMAFFQPARGDDPSTSGVDETHDARWEIESCSLPISEIRAKITGCLKKTDADGTATFGVDPEDWIRSSYPNCDFPPEPVPDGPLSSTYEFTFLNNWKLDAGLDAYGIFRRITNVTKSDPDNVVAPKVRSATVVIWELVKVEEQRARNILVTRGAGSSWTVDDYWDGADPEECGALDIACLFNCECLQEGQKAYGNYDPENDKYWLTATASAMLGAPEEINFILGDGFDFSGCGIVGNRRTFKSFPCNSEVIPMAINPTLTGAVYVSNVSLGASGLKIDYGIAYVCGSYAIGSYTHETEPCPCTGECTWEWSYASQTWSLLTACANGCDCGSPPPDPANAADPASNGATLNATCGSSTPCSGSCTWVWNFDNQEWDLTEACSSGCVCGDPPADPANGASAESNGITLVFNCVR